MSKSKPRLYVLIMVCQHNTNWSSNTLVPNFLEPNKSIGVGVARIQNTHKVYYDFIYLVNNTISLILQQYVKQSFFIKSFVNMKICQGFIINFACQEIKSVIIQEITTIND